MSHKRTHAVGDVINMIPAEPGWRVCLRLAGGDPEEWEEGPVVGFAVVVRYVEEEIEDQYGDFETDLEPVWVDGDGYLMTPSKARRDLDDDQFLSVKLVRKSEEAAL